ncbi:Malonyl CoA-acyl carrier protein transacylase [Pseudomonas chlororaphis subsp. piscium]|uniref:SDR family NAD(P)-dependent oxidoreductase n=1 Tax=Pseudomonas chlororaphis TaxID=587753 RepID=UPI000F56EBBF|nr:SDR family NAD(P)-dependent oxidoreductase [Pseudomonas chlororaphis]AZC75016.1 Malonyl CoA-acyl carrier protein transacylase [Pseudomonas chlororaphis subsp. piscium]
MNDRDDQLIVLSALQAQTLPVLAQQLLEHVLGRPDLALPDIAYTLQVGREALPHRLVLLAASMAQLIARLQDYVQSPEALEPPFWSGVAERARVEQWSVEQSREASHESLARAWVDGVTLPWAGLWAGQAVRRTSLPGYPFERERHWAQPEQVAQAEPQGGVTHQAHLSGNEFFLLDHRLNGRAILPGMMYIELLSRALRAAGQPAAPFQLRDLLWLQPMWGDAAGIDLQVLLRAGGERGQQLEVRSRAADGQWVVHCKAEVCAPLRTASRLDIPALEQQAKSQFTGAECYPQLTAMGLEYGPGHQCMERLWVGDFGVLVKLRAPELTEPAQEDFLVHPGVFDSALQAALGLNMQVSGVGQASVPFALAHFELLSASAPPCWAWLRPQPGAGSSAALQLIDIDLFDAEGEPVALLHGLASRALTPSSTASTGPAQAPAAPAPALGSAGDLRYAALAYFRQQFARILRLNEDDIQEQVQLEQYGIDSIIIIRLTDELEKTFGRLSKTLFFEYQSLGEVTDYFMAEHAAVLQGILEPETQAPSPAVVGVAAAPVVAAEAPAPMRTASEDDDQEIAIIGLAGRYPGARNMEEFWSCLANAQDMIREIPAERWDHQRFYDPAKNTIGKTYCKHGGFIDDVDKFDPLFFGISPREAIGMEPQERLFLECAYETLEDAGYTRSSLPAAPGGGKGRSVGVFVGVMYEEYQLFGAQSTERGYPFAVPGHPASIANRVSYIFNLQGPSIALDTMCSSSITTLHLACRSIRDGECEMALAGGVNVSIHPNKYLMLGQGGFASAKGRCESFGEGGEGYVPGEGVGAVLLKRKRQAIADGDQIYGVIKASVLNHGGKTNGYTVPNPLAQAELISAALAQARVPARAVSYIEAHGTGTPLGDPIEIAGLSRAFARQTQDRGFCAIGSVKSNIGHCESAAGIAGISKVLLQIRHGQLAPSLHSATLNPNIDFAGSPFYVQRSLMPWQRPTLSEDAVEKTWSRLAGISSFGAGGANAHLLIEEYLPSSVPPHTARSMPVAIVLSAKTATALHLSVQRLAAALASPALSSADLSGIAFTLQVGREAMSERLALCVSSHQELRTRLEAWLQGDKVAAGLLSATVSAASASGPSVAATDLPAAVAAWVAGQEVDWRTAYAQPYPQKVSLPTYPFARERYWVEDEVESAMLADAGRAGQWPTTRPLHPLVQSNTSCVGQQRFSSRFDGREFFLDEHRINGEKLLPAAASIEMFMAAAKLSHRQGRGGSALRLSQLAWLQPIWQRTAELRLDIEVQGEPDTADWHLRCVDAQDPERVYCQATVADCPSRSIRHDVEQLIAGCSRHLSGAELYQRYREAGYEYGESFQSIETLWGSDDYVIAKLHMPQAREASQAKPFDVPPSLLDGALQASAGLMLPGAPAGFSVALPFAIDSLELYGPCENTLWAYVRRQPAQSKAITRFDIDLCNRAGNVCVAIKGFSSLRLKSGDTTGPTMTTPGSTPHTLASRATTEAEQKVYLLPQWTLAQPESSPLSHDLRRLLILGSRQEDLARIVEGQPDAVCLQVSPDSGSAELLALLEGRDIEHLIWVAPSDRHSPFDQAAILQAQQGGVMFLFNLFKALQQMPVASTVFELTVVQYETSSFDGQASNFTQAGVHGLVGTMAKESPRWRVRSVDIECDSVGALNDILRQPCDPLGLQRVRRNGHWYVRQWLKTEFQQPPHGDYLCQDGVYVVIGGAGGLGTAWSEYAIGHCNAQVIWLGRRALDADIQRQIDSCAQAGRAPVYYQADACDLEALQACLRQVRQRFGSIHGVIHSALLLEDSTLANMDEATLRRVYFAKLQSSLNLGIALREAPPQFLLFFSSTVVFTPPPGQANYSAGCLFQNALAEQLARELPSRVKVINWGFWGNTGVAASAHYRELMARNGIASIEPVDGMEALNYLFGDDLDQLALLKVTDKVRNPPALIPSDEQLTVLAAQSGLPGRDSDQAARPDGSVVERWRQWTATPGAAVSILDMGGCFAARGDVLEPLQATQRYVCSHDGDAERLMIAGLEGQVGGLQAVAFDPQCDIAGQGLKPGEYDLVIALAQAAGDFRLTLRHIKVLLKRQGTLLVASHGRPDELRLALHREGFKVMGQLSDTVSGEVLEAVSDGVIRQPLRSSANAQHAPQASQPPVTAQTAQVHEGQLLDAALVHFKRLIAQELRIPVERLDVDEPLDSYGIDSIYSVRLVAILNQSFADVSNTLFFEVQNIRALVMHFINKHRLELETLLGVQSTPSDVAPAPAFVPPAPIPLAAWPQAPSAVTDPRSSACDIAVIGMSGRYAQADDLEEFWQNLSQGRNCISEIPPKRWDWRQHFDEQRGKWGKHYSKWGGFIRDIDAFDPLFFQISPTEAERMDPQSRLFLEQAYACIEEAGYTPGTLSNGNRVGVFVGAMNADYVNGASYWSIANRVSYLFDFKGPSLAVDTACSSSLSAIHLAIDSLLLGSCDSAIAGGVNLIMSPTHYMGLSLMGMLSESDQCRAFGADADGFVDGEGVGAILLKPLSAAVAAGDHIYGVIKGSAMNAGGRTSGFTVPNPAAQTAVVSEALRRSGVPARHISYVEAHGTGTPLGDPIEIKGLSDAFAEAGNERQFCALGSVKSNIGHCESAAGIASVTKVLLQLKHSTLLPTLHSERSNPRIDFARTPFKLQLSAQEWQRLSVEVDGQMHSVARSAGISSFGAGGANAHLIIQEYQDPRPRTPIASGVALILLSAQSVPQLRQRAERLLAHLQGSGAQVDLRDLAYTLQVGREPMEHRLAFGASTREAVCETLKAFVEGRDVERGELFQGSVQDHREAMGLLQGDEDLRQTIDHWFEKGKLGKLLALWVKGLQVDWQRFYAGRPGRRVSLPTYPFAKEFFWLDLGVQAVALLPSLAAPAQLHPLMQENRSGLEGVRYVSHFNGSEPLFRDHRVARQRLLPAAAQVEMIRCAATSALGQAVDSVMPMRLRDLAWVTPVSGEQPLSLELVLKRTATDLQFCLGQSISAAEETFHCQGSIDFPERQARSVVDLDSLRDAYPPLALGAADFYQRLAEHGLEYGASLRTLTWLGSKPDSVLVGLSADPQAYADARYVIDPGVLDGVLQALALFEPAAAAGPQPSIALPFAADSIELFAACRGTLWAHLRRQPAFNALGPKTDIDVYDQAGGLCLSLRGLVTRGLPADATPSLEDDALVILSPRWTLANL